MSECLLYATKTFCPRCTLVERRGLHLTDAQVVSKPDNKVYLKSLCSRHPSQYTLYCSSLSFFNRILSYTTDSIDKKLNQDIEDICQRYSQLQIQQQQQQPTTQQPNNSNNNNTNNANTSLIIELNIYQNSIFLNDETICSNIKQFQSLYPKNRKFSLKVMAKGSNDVQTINNKVIYIASLLKGYPILVEVTVERLNMIGNLANSCFLLGKVYPALKYFLKQGDEELFIKDMHRLLAILGQYNGIQAVITVALERKFANLHSILELLRSKNEVIRIIILSLERPPKEIVSSLQKKMVIQGNQVSSSTSSTTASSLTLEDAESTDLQINCNDPYELIQEIERATDKSISSDDFFPVNVGSALEPMLNLMGYGMFSIRPSPFCGFATLLINTDTIHSRPINKLFNIGKFYRDLQPLLPSLEEKIGFFNGLRLKSIIKSCHWDNVPIPNIFDYFTDRAKADITKRVIDQTQILIIHNNMDIAALDLRRRCNCAVSTKTKDGFVSSCTGCI
ncbi:hypothetical protein SAMD00019534_124970 [Acytostelium subglobosum LB1]|uniref:hypothetical protein n=1 Tax=Acytostelium subglobosum LB1 TaxID=1410327 RepID=UPI000644FBE3|nr:hypothetical protein SAMD00019534_124970 [Acytostelium subglobosum LB1]GAM29321.1 hypothetical protein SAMD00019534_124970 [Acytostelium subglobosum LB1]|eukprot:XP_012747748.1 hypothetical protein SAMD00019534_124970 [Acytostelium subglobosum LB1]